MTKRKPEPCTFAPRPIAERLFGRVAVNHLTGCIEWQGCATPCGYGRLLLGSRRDGSRKVALAHRVAWELVHGPIPDRLLACHHCDNPRCVNVSHLFLGTHEDNMRDMTLKGRRKPIPRDNWRPTLCMPKRRKFTPEQIAEIRVRLSRGETAHRISKDYGVSKNTIRCIHLGRSYHTDPEQESVQP